MIKRKPWQDYLIIILGAIIFAASVNIFIVPVGLYNGGIVGLSQIVRTIIVDVLGVNGNFDIAGIINFMFNIPLFLLAYKSISKKFLYGTLLSVIVQTIAFTLIPIPVVPIVDDVLASAAIGGILAGFGVGITLLTATCCGGTDILGVWASLHLKDFSVGKLTLIFNVFVYLFCAFKFDLETAIYSVIYTSIFSLVVDRIHLQNIEMYMMIFTKNPEVKKMINQEFVRGVTYWKGMGAYTNEETEVLVTICSKYEVNQLKRRIHKLDNKSFIIVDGNVNVLGGYEKRLLV